MKHPSQQITLQDYIDTIHGCNDRVKMLTEQIRQLSVQSRLYPLIQAYRLPARKTREIQKRQEGVPKEIRDIAWEAQLRLCSRYRHLTGRGKNPNVAKTAAPPAVCLDG